SKRTSSSRRSSATISVYPGRALSTARRNSSSSYWSACPFFSVLGSARYAIARAGAFGSTSRPSFARARYSSARGKSVVATRRIRSCIAVSIPPGLIADAVTPVPSSSSARLRVICTTAAFAAEYAVQPELGRVAEPEEMLTMRPKPRSSIPGSTTRTGRYVPPTLIAMLRSHSAGSDLERGAIGSTMPAQFTRIDAGPTQRAVASPRSWTWRSSATSAVCASAWPPERLIVFTTSSSSGALRDASTTDAPRAASVSATARPSPRPAPVTMATCPLRGATAATIPKGSIRSANGAGERARERVRETVDVALLVQRPERESDRLQTGLGQVLDDDALLAPHALDHLERGRTARRDDDDARWVGMGRENVERQVGKTFEQARAQRAEALAHRATETAVHREGLPQSVERAGVDGADLEARRLGLQGHVALEIHRALRAPSEPRAFEAVGVLHPERAHAERPVQPLVSKECVRIGTERADIYRDLAERLRAVDDHRRARVVRDARGVGDREHLAALAANEGHDERLGTVSERLAHVVEEARVITVRDHLHAIPARTAREHRQQRAAVLLRGRHDERAALARHARTKAQAADEDVQPVGRGLRECDARGTALVADRAGEVGPYLIESGVVLVVPDVRE